MAALNASTSSSSAASPPHASRSLSPASAILMCDTHRAVPLNESERTEYLGLPVSTDVPAVHAVLIKFAELDSIREAILRDEPTNFRTWSIVSQLQMETRGSRAVEDVRDPHVKVQSFHRKYVDTTAIRVKDMVKKTSWFDELRRTAVRQAAIEAGVFPASLSGGVPLDFLKQMVLRQILALNPEPRS
jgi:hypothetical protein